ncbi:MULTISPECIES: phosphoribosyltransferase [Hahella]|uniref:Predicted phosphoribosyltransferase n=1 Tax=Hahella chejuensis (strain KCTC 2396) TaxID=349521 RepID=Q2SFK6_HAHCH|nr:MULTISPECIES: phosphoribosyltransferase family protein [Hahella]MBU6953632.1 hypoxanthine phosphoribosyltransferase [Hahella sp. HN01]ABC30568.1 predicted phosphoribosyltransferase [Hahella chejuensis KCTC 2396]AZZ92107.1 hypoxanthine phosphoribosyltransferase [Hahella sp. KA22]QAY55478.1 hypoxanthine phosphoribosyltransferase [Hahella sp. KA22]WLQ15928.1 phosphoribosyltransferase family protein [Hahella sp. HNIBRBA332]
MEKTFISAQQLLDDSFKLGLKIYESGYRPNYIVGVWRGGAPVGIAVQELLDFLGVESDHIAIRTSSYTGIGERSRHVTVHGLNYMVKRVNAEDSVLIVDDVYDTGLSVQQVVTDLKAACRKNTPDIKIATPYFKPSNNKTDKVPDYFVHETDQWLVFPHELHGLTTEEILEHKPELAVIHDKLLKLREGENS